MRRALLVLIAAALAPPAARGQDDRSLDRVRGAGALRVAVDTTYPPMEFEGPDGSPAGFDVDLARELARRLGARAEFVVCGWDGIVAGLDARRYDAIVSSVGVTAERRTRLAFVEYLRASQVFVARKGTPFAGEADLAGKVVAVPADTTSFAWVEGRRDALGVRDVQAFRDATDAFLAVKAGQAEVIVVDEPVGRYYVRQDPATFAVAGRATDPEPIGVAVRKEDEALRAALAGALEAMRRDGSFAALEEGWFGGGPDEPGFWGYSSRVVLPRLLQGMWLTLQLTAAAGLLGVALGFGVALARLSGRRGVRWAAAGYVTLFRGTPLLLQVLFFYFALPPLLGVRLGAMTAGVLALSLNMAGYTAEVFRAGIQSVDPGQTEAARALGLSRWQALWYVVLPQAYRRLLPPLVNDLAALSKDTSLVSVLALHETLFVTQRLAAAYLRPWAVYAWAAAGYLLIVLALAAAAGRLERRLNRGQP